MSSIFRHLSEDDLARFHGMLRQDALKDLDLARWAEERIGRSVGATDHAREAAVSRYRKSRAYRHYSATWGEQELKLKLELAAQAERFRFLAKAVEAPEGEGVERLSNAVQARLLTLAAETTDDDLRSGMETGWIRGALQAARDQVRDQYRARVEKLKTDLQKLMSGPEKTTLTPADVVRRVDEIMGLAG